MSAADVTRFVNNLKTDASLLAEVKANASGVGSVVEIARAHGYSVTVDEARNYIQSQTASQLSDEQLDAIAGGKGSSSTTQVSTVQTAVSVTTEATMAETTTNAAAEAEVAAVAVAVIVLT